MSWSVAKTALALRWAAAPVALVASSALVWNASYSAFSATTNNPGNNWTAGTVALSDDDANAAMFTVTNLKPGVAAGGSKCIVVTYNGSLAAAVKLYGSSTGALNTYLNVKVEEGTGGTFASCTGFTPGATVYTGTLAGLPASYAAGVGSFAPTAAGQTKTYRISYDLQDNQAAQAQTANATFTWEAQNV